jgi:predicted HAD superfamily Cof-like phosphohydrolase
MDKYLKSVNEFHTHFNHPINSYKEDIDLKTRQLRIKLLFEEIQELSEASDVKNTFFNLCKDVVGFDQKIDGNNVDKKGELDALCDIMYILMGGVLVLGHQENFETAFEEVHNSNMSKMCNSEEEVIKTIEYYKEKDGTEAISVVKGDKWIVLRKNDGKVLKNVFYKEADLNKFVE